MLFDRPDVIAEAQHAIRDLGPDERVDLVEGDFFEEAPAGADLYLLKWILHDTPVPHPLAGAGTKFWPAGAVA